LTAGVESHPRAVALDPATGRPVWQAAFADRAHYSKAEAPPSFAGGRVFVRNDEEIAAVTIGN
jgi:outer membrane protein assembly factor BamB